MTAIQPSAHPGSGRWRHLLALLVAWGPQGLFLLAVLDSAGLPVVGGVDLLLVNVAASTPSKAYLAAACAVAGSLLGSAILFAITRKGGDLMLSRYLATARGARIHRWFERYGLVTVFIPALSPLPLPMKIPVACAGALKVRWSYFLSTVFAARCLRYFALAYFGARFGAQTLLYLRTHLLSVAVIALAIAAALVIGLQIMDRRLRRNLRCPGMLKLTLYASFAVTCCGAELTSQQIFNHVRENVAKQLSAASNYTCVQTVERTINFDPKARKSGCSRTDLKNEKPFMHDRLRLDVAVSEGNEIFSWHGGSKFSSAGVNDVVKSGPISSGSFVGYLRNILFTPGVAINMERELTAGNSKSYEFTYFVPLRSSGYRIRARKGIFAVPYYGSFTAVGDAFELRSLSVTAGDIPASAEVCSADTEISYQSVDIAGKLLLLPKSFELHLSDTQSLDTVSRSEYKQCREFRGESTLRFDFDDSAQAQSATAIHDQWIPPGNELHVRLKTDLNEKDSFTGDPVEGVLLNPVHLKNSNITIPKGALISGVVSRLELRYQPAVHYSVGIHFDRLTFGPNSMLLSASPKRIYTQQIRGARGFANLAPLVSVDDSEGEASFVMLSSHLRIDQSFSAYWETGPPPKESEEPSH